MVSSTKLYVPFPETSGVTFALVQLPAATGPVMPGADDEIEADGWLAYVMPVSAQELSLTPNTSKPTDWGAVRPDPEGGRGHQPAEAADGEAKVAAHVRRASTRSVDWVP